MPDEDALEDCGWRAGPAERDLLEPLVQLRQNRRRQRVGHARRPVVEGRVGRGLSRGVWHRAGANGQQVLSEDLWPVLWPRRQQELDVVHAEVEMLPARQPGTGTGTGSKPDT